MKNHEIIDKINTHISDTWGVYWSEMETVRDFLQNFYDANPIEDIKIDANDNRVTVFAPSFFDWKELIVFGSDKRFNDETVGNYGEGFKASLLNAMRNFNIIVSMHIGDNLLTFYFENEKIGRTTKRLIWCERRKAKQINGSQLILGNCPPQIIKEFMFGLNYFYYENNPLFGDLIANAHEMDILIYQSTSNEGFLFYKKLLRAKLDVPLVIVCNRTYKRVDDKILHDRDRKAFNDEVKGILLNYLFKPIPVSKIVNFLQHHWEKGHKILSIIADSVRSNFKMDFPDNYYAKDRKLGMREVDLHSELDAIIRDFKKKGYICCPHYMNRLGMKTPHEVAIKKHEAAKKKYATTFSRKPTKAENESLEILFSSIRQIQPFLANQFNGAIYLIGESDEVIGELKDKKKWGVQEVFLNKKYFLYDFSEAMAVLLHEWGHIHGYDSSRRFTDALTEFIASIIKNRDIFDVHEKKWQSNLINIKQERKDHALEVGIASRIDNLTTEDKFEIIKSIPEDELFKLLESTGIL